MSLTEEFSFSKEGNIEENTLIRKLFLSMVIILIASLSFGLGRLTGGGDRQGIRLEIDPSLTGAEQSASALQAAKTVAPNVFKAGEVQASSKGSKYHYAHCPGAKQISEANRVIFASAEAAEASGYALAANCRPR